MAGSKRRAGIVRDALGVGVATGAYGLSFGALSTAAGLSLWQTCALSLLMFTGGSQFALIGVAGGGGGALAGAATAVLLGSRNALYGLRLSSVLQLTSPRRMAAAQLVIDESAAMALAQPEPRHARLAFWSTGLSVFVLWNLGTLVGALGGQALSDPRDLGLDAAVPAAFLALLAPRMRSRTAWRVGAIALVVALLATPFTPAGVPVLLAAAVAALAAGDPAAGEGGGKREDDEGGGL